ncbi:hypothetical protein JXB12_06640 [candidate division KSB1 bacterium]|nr:hypothetical protein [candidate division KSB1 bacterium]
MKNRIVLLTPFDNFFGQTRRPWVSMDVDKIIATFRDGNVDVKLHTLHEIYNKKIELHDEIIFYSFSQKENIRNYIKDMIYFLSADNIVIPSLDLLYCHENKGYQELLKKKLGFDSLHAHYFCSYRDLKNYDIQYPVVLKTTDGSNADGVFLIHDAEQLYDTLKKLSVKGGIMTSIDLFRRKYLRRRKFDYYPDYNDREDYYQYKFHITREKNFILQEYVPGLDHDFRVLIMYDKYYFAKRHVNKGDFRASGTKKFDFNIEADPGLLNYAEDVFRKLDNPTLSIDIMSRDGQYFLGEYQALHFGISALIKSHGYYSKQADGWQFIENKSSIERELTLAVINYLRNKQLC